LEALDIIDLKENPRGDLDRSESVVDPLLDDATWSRGKDTDCVRQAAVSHLADHVIRAHLKRVRLAPVRDHHSGQPRRCSEGTANANLVRAPPN
jgi:hypothetical protein